MNDPLSTWLDQLVLGSGVDRPEPDDALPAALGLEFVSWVARGPSAAVARARDPHLDRDVAVKVSNRDHESRDALLAEAASTARLVHPGVLPVHRVVDLEGRVFVEMRWGSSRTLVHAAEALRLDPPPLAQRLALLRSIASALAHAHGRGIVHGDVHPGNILVGDAFEAWLCDWGAATGLAGHPGYAAPDRLRGQAATPAHDVFSLGVVAWELCGARELRTRRHEELLGAWVARSLAQPVPELTALPPWVTALVSAMTGPSTTCPTADDVVATLDRGATDGAVRAWCDAAAEQSLERARSALVRQRGLARRRAEEDRVVAVLRAKVPPHAPALDKRPILEAEDRVRARAAEALDATFEALDALAVARHLAADPATAEEVTAELWWERLTEAEAMGDAVAVAQAARRIDGATTFGAQRVAARMRAPGTVSVSASRPGATVRLAPVVERGTVLVPGPAVHLPLPLAPRSLDPGSWLLTVEAPGYAPSTVSLRLERLQHAVVQAQLWTEDEIGTGWCVVPAGPFRMGGDPGARNPIAACDPFVGDRFMLRTCVTSAAYRAFLNDLPTDEALARCPGEIGLFGERSHYWTRDEAWKLPEGWPADWPVMGVSLDDAEAYARWVSVKEGRRVRVPTEEEWEKASRGADGRAWPWGNRFDPTHGHMRESRPGAPRPAPVGVYPMDRSVYGVLDTAGGMREWTTSTYQDGQVVVRGGTWGDDADDCRCASRAGLQPSFRMPWVSFRLVSEVPRPA